MTRWHLRLLLLFLASFSLSLVVHLPASLALSWAGPALQRSGLSLAGAGTSGTVWQGQVDNITYRRLDISRVAWEWQAADLLRGVIGTALHVSLPGAGNHQLGADIEFDPFGGQLAVSSLQGSADLSIASKLGLVPPELVSGELLINIRSLVVENGVPIAIDGQGALENLGNLYLPGIPLGSYQARLTTEGNTLVGRFSDLDAPVETRGEVTLAPDGRYQLTARLRPRENAAPILVSGLDFLGPADNDGFKTFKTAGRL
ncbi:MAG: type II secretion system protein N [Gammaproteobacteria bacterium]|nr:type II secretion system protein N [Gammaproteobacteria bacterium]